MSTQLAEIKNVVSQVVELPDSSVEAFIDIFRPDKLAKGEDFVKEGEVGGCIAFLRSGLLRSYYISPKGDEYNKHFFVAGSFIAPLTSLVLKSKSSLYIGALEDSELLVAKYSDLEKLYKTHLDINILGRKLVEFAWIGKEQRETQLIMLGATERYETFLEEFPGLDQRIPQYQVASYLGITPVQLSRIRAQKR